MVNQRCKNALCKFNCLFAISILVLISTVSCLSGCVTDEEERRSAMQIVYPNFEMYIDDFEKVKNLVLELRKSDYYLMEVKDNFTTLSYYSRETDSLVEIELSSDELQSVKNIILNTKRNRRKIDVYVDDNMVRFECESVANGVMWTDNIDNVKENTKGPFQYTHFEDCWYVVLYYN